MLYFKLGTGASETATKRNGSGAGTSKIFITGTFV